MSLADDPLGNFEHLTLAAVSDLRQEAYAAAVADRLLSQVGSGFAVAQAYVMIRRLVDKEFLAKLDAGPGLSPAGRGRPVRHRFEITGTGMEALVRSVAFHRRMAVVDGSRMPDREQALA